MWVGPVSTTESNSILHDASINSILTHTLPKWNEWGKGQVRVCTSLHYAVILIKCTPLDSLSHSVMEGVRCAWDWWVLFSSSNSSSGAVLNNDQHIWLMSAVGGCRGEGVRLCGSYLTCRAMRAFHFRGRVMMMDTIRPQLSHWSHHTSWSFTSGTRKMNCGPSSRTGEVIFSDAHMKVKKERKKRWHRGNVA